MSRFQFFFNVRCEPARMPRATLPGEKIVTDAGEMAGGVQKHRVPRLACNAHDEQGHVLFRVGAGGL